MGRQLHINTNFGATFVDEDTPVYVKVGAAVLEKRAADLQPKDHIMVYNDGFSLTFDKIVEVLEQNEAYCNARDALHERNSKGEHIPRLRTLTLRGLGGADDMLEARILREADDFTQDQRDDFAQQVKETGVTVAISTIRDAWLTGRTIAPENWDNLAQLAQINPVFSEYHESKRTMTGFAAAYDLYTNARKLVPAVLAKRTGKNCGNGHSRNGERHGFFHDIIIEVMRSVPGAIDDEKGYAVVEAVVPVQKNGKGGTAQAGTGLRRGIYRGEIELEKRSADDVFLAFRLLSAAIHDSIYKYLEQPRVGRVVSRHMQDLFDTYIMAQLTNAPYIRRTLDYDLQLLAKDRNDRAALLEACRQVYSRFAEDMKSGEVDKMLNAEAFTLSRTVSAFKEYQHAIPKPYARILELEGDLIIAQEQIKQARNADRKERRELQRRGQQLAEQFRAAEQQISRYGTHPELLPMPFLHHYRQQAGTTERMPHPFMYRREEEGKGARFFTKAEAQRTLEAAQLAYVLPLLDPGNF